MPTCAVCGEESDNVITCKTCGDKFCAADCGDANKKLCIFCIDIDDEDTDESLDEEDV